MKITKDFKGFLVAFVITISLMIILSGCAYYGRGNIDLNYKSENLNCTAPDNTDTYTKGGQHVYGEDAAGFLEYAALELSLEYDIEETDD